MSYPDGSGVGRDQMLYEVHDHLGNVRVVLTDDKAYTSGATADITSYYNYYAFGSLKYT